MSSAQCQEEISVPNFVRSIQRDPQSLPSFNTVLSDSFLTQTYGLSFQQQLEHHHQNVQFQSNITSSPLLSSPHVLGSSEIRPLQSLNLFQAGFEDCASEVLHFLKVQEQLEGGNHLLLGLRSHLMNISSLIAAEDFNLPSCSPSLPSHKLRDSHNTSSPVSAESVFSSYLNSGKGLVHNSCPKSTVTVSTSTSQSVMSPKSDETMKSCGRRKRSSDSTLTSLSSSPVFGVSLFREDHSLSPIPAKRVCFSHNNEKTKEVPSLSDLATEAVKLRNIRLPSESKSLSQSSSYLPCSHSEAKSLALSSTLNKLPHITSKNTSFSQLSSSSRLLPSQTLLCEIEQNTSQTQSVLSPPYPPSQSTTESVHTHVSDLSTLTDDNLDDVLQSVESCQSHEDPRVRDLAAHIISLINNVDDKDDDEVENVDDDFEHDVDCEGHRTEFEDSGIDLEED